MGPDAELKNRIGVRFVAIPRVTKDFRPLTDEGTAALGSTREPQAEPACRVRLKEFFVDLRPCTYGHPRPLVADIWWLSSRASKSSASTRAKAFGRVLCYFLPGASFIVFKNSVLVGALSQAPRSLWAYRLSRILCLPLDAGALPCTPLQPVS